MESTICCLWVWLISLSVMHLRFVDDVAGSFLLPRGIPLCGCTRACLSFPQLRNFWVVSRFGRLLINCYKHLHTGFCVNISSFRLTSVWWMSSLSVCSFIDCAFVIFSLRCYIFTKRNHHLAQSVKISQVSEFFVLYLCLWSTLS